MSKTYFDYISETIKARNKIFSTDTPRGLENIIFQPGHQVALPPQVVPPRYVKNLF